MIFSPSGYHLCKALPFKPDLEWFKSYPKAHPYKYCVCQWFFDVVMSVGSFEWVEAKHNIPNTCPKGYDLETIENKILLLHKSVDFENRPDYGTEKWFKQWEAVNSALKNLFTEGA